MDTKVYVVSVYYLCSDCNETIGAYSSLELAISNVNAYAYQLLGCDSVKRAEPWDEGNRTYEMTARNHSGGIFIFTIECLSLDDSWATL